MSKSSVFQLFLVLWLCGVFVQQLIFRDMWPDVLAGERQLVGVVREQVDQQGLVQRARVQSDGIPGFVQVEVGSYPTLLVGDVVTVLCTIQPIRTLAVTEFRYDRYLAKEHVYAVCKGYGSPQIVGVEHGWRRTMDRWRQGFAGLIQRHLQEPHASLLIGLLYGARSTLPADLVDAFRRTGTMHIVAVSGFNVTVVSNAILLLLTLTFLKRQRAYAVVLIGVFLFVLFAGADAAVVRAGIMGALVLTAKHLGRPRVTVTLFLIAASVMLLINPRMLLDDVGFQLSFVAAIGLVTLGPVFQRWFFFLPKKLNLRSILSETLAATFATMPISLWQFKTVSLISPIANLFVIPWIILAMSLGMMGVLVSLISSAIGTVAFLPVAVILEIMLTFVRVFAPLPIIDFAL